MITAELIQGRLEKFWGYGNLSAPVWFVGMEEGLGDKDTKELELRNELQKRFEATDGKQTIDIRDDMQSVPRHLKFYTPPKRSSQKTPIQMSFLYPIALCLYLHNNSIPTLEDIREYQLHNLGDVHTGQSAVLELSSLPARSTGKGEWIYGEYGIDGLSTRADFENICLPKRCSRLAALVADHSPILVIFYSRNYMSYWRTIAGTTLTEITPQMDFGRSNQTSFCAIPHRRSRGMSYARVYDFASKISKDVGLNPLLVT